MGKTEEDLDDVLKRIGQFGKYQIYIYLLLSLPALFAGIVSITYVFSAAELPYRYVKPVSKSPKIEIYL